MGLEAETLLADTGWVPEPLRTPGLASDQSEPKVNADANIAMNDSSVGEADGPDDDWTIDPEGDNLKDHDEGETEAVAAE